VLATAPAPGAPFAAGLRCYHVDDYQQYLAKHPYGYRCHAATGIPFPTDS
jgi:peptide-methionine (S)-S-oxide reductase